MKGTTMKALSLGCTNDLKNSKKLNLVEFELSRCEGRSEAEIRKEMGDFGQIM